jgi:hypothetical protein
MKLLSSLARSVRLAALTLFVQACILSGTAVSALQNAPALILSGDPKDPKDRIDTLLLRPNSVQPLFVYVQNPSEEAQKVTVIAKGSDGSELGRAAVVAPPGKATRVAFPKVEPPKGEAPKVEPDKKADKKGPEWIEHKGPPFKLQLQLLDGKQNVVQNKVLEVAIMPPVQYLDASAAWEPEKSRISVTTKLLGAFSGPPCSVEMVLPPALLPGVVPASLNDGTFRETLSKPGEQKRLLADNLKFQGTQRTGYVYLNVDGFERAFIFQADLSGTSGTTPFNSIRDNALRAVGAFPKDKGVILYTPPVARYPLRLEVDTPQVGAQVVVGLDRNRDQGFEETETLRLPGSKQVKVWSNPEFPDGGFQFKTEVRDWTAGLDSNGLLGEHALRIQLLDAGGAELGRIDGSIMFDPTPPDKIAFQMPSKVIKGTKVAVKAQVQDPESPIVKGQFFFGAVKDGKLVADGEPVEARKLSKDEDVWTAALALPDGKKAVELAAQFTNAAGLTATQSIKLEVVEPPPPSGTIKGKVVAGDRPQAGLEVQLREEKDTKATTKTGPKGEFSFENVKPGPYKIFVQQKETMTEGTASVTVEVDKTKEVTVELVRKAKAK